MGRGQITRTWVAKESGQRLGVQGLPGQRSIGQGPSPFVWQKETRSQESEFFVLRTYVVAGVELKESHIDRKVNGASSPQREETIQM